MFDPTRPDPSEQIYDHGGRSSMDDAELAAWVVRLVERYPAVEDVFLVGGETFGSSRRFPIQDVLIVLEAATYAWGTGATPHSTWTCPIPRDKLEQRIAYDPALRRNGLYVWFYRPDGEIGWWAFGPDEPVPSVDVTVGVADKERIGHPGDC
jgi:hypothetical protein